MCGRYYFDDETMEDVRNLVDFIDEGLKSKSISGDIYPSEQAPVITAGQYPARLAAGLMSWGFQAENIGDVSLQKNTSRRLINARAETAFDKITFKESVRRRRCVIPAGHYYEWDKSKNKVSFYADDRQSMYMAGFYRKYKEQWHFIIVTTKANYSVEKIHDRMPLILKREEIIPWIYDAESAGRILKKVPEPICPVILYEQQRILF